MAQTPLTYQLRTIDGQAGPLCDKFGSRRALPFDNHCPKDAAEVCPLSAPLAYNIQSVGSSWTM